MTGNPRARQSSGLAGPSGSFVHGRPPIVRKNVRLRNVVGRGCGKLGTVAMRTQLEELPQFSGKY
jgi:hypothetical protein